MKSEQGNSNTMQISEIYKRYNIMRQLQMHMFRVASVAVVVFDGLAEAGEKFADGDRDVLIQACLLHDMGNIVKFNLDFMPETLEPEGREHWEKIKSETIEQYGPEQHIATMKIIAEIGVSPRICELAGGIGFWNACKHLEGSDMLAKIASYSDMRVTPLGIESLSARLEDLKNRYASHNNDRSEEVKTVENCLSDIERKLFTRLPFSPDSITEDSTASTREELSEYIVAKENSR